MEVVQCERCDGLGSIQKELPPEAGAKYTIVYCPACHGRGRIEFCAVCSEWDHPCEGCARRIHESWHIMGWHWIRSEMCHPQCPGLPNRWNRIAYRLELERIESLLRGQVDLLPGT